MADGVIHWYDNSGNSKGILPYDDATHEEDLDGTDMLTVTTERLPYKRDRLLWMDSAAVWREHMVDTTERTHRNARPRTVAKCSNSISELYGVRASGTIATATVQAHLAALLADTRWTAGSCDIDGAYQLEYWHKNVRECIAELCELCGGELETQIVVGSWGVTQRIVRIVRARGSSNAIRQFTYGRNVSGINREVSADEVYTAVIGYGARAQTEDESDYAPRLTVTATTGTSNLGSYGIRMGDGSLGHNYDTYTDTECTSAQFLMQQCRKILDAESKPLVRYEFDVPEADNARLWKDVQLGDVVQCVDDEFSPAMELTERVSHISRRLSGRISCKIAIGSRKNPLVEKFKAQKLLEETLPTTPSPTSGGDYPNDIDPIDTGTIDDYWPTESDPDSAGASEYLPYAIDITTEPTDLEYTDGEPIDFSGIVVTLKNEDGTTYTSDAYPDGIVPFSELSFPTTTADITQAVEEGGTNSGTSIIVDNVNIGGPLSYASVSTSQFGSSTGTAVGTHTSGSTLYWFTYCASGISVRATRYVSSGGYALIFASENAAIRQDGSGGGGAIYYDERNLLTSYGSAGRSVTIGGKTAYYQRIDIGSGVASFISESGTITDPARAAWEMLYGTDFVINRGQTVPVQWQRSDGTTLEDTYSITVSEDEFASATDEGWTDMGGGFSGSGGGTIGGSASSSGGGGGGSGSGGGGSY